MTWQLCARGLFSLGVGCFVALGSGCDSETKTADSPGSPAAGPASGGATASVASNAPDGVYGEIGGDIVAPADPGLPDTLLRSRAGDTFYQISKARLGQDQFGRPTLDVQYETLHSGEHNGVTLVMHGIDGSHQSFLILGPMQTRGTLSVGLPFPLPPGAPPLPKAVEVYLTRGDVRYQPDSPTFKVSNSTTIGGMQARTRPRNWTEEELARFTQPPPNYANADAHPSVGRDTEFAGDTTGGVPRRYVEPNGKLLGLDWRIGEWDGEACFGALTPVFSAKQPPGILTQRVIARDGYAVGEMRVRSRRYASAIQLVYYRVKADGGLDAADTYESEWFGVPGADGMLKTLGSSAQPAIGIVCQQGAIVNGVALVTR